MDHPLGHNLTLGVDDPLLHHLSRLVDNQLAPAAHDVGGVDLNDLLVGGVDNNLLAPRVEENLPALLDQGPSLHQLTPSVDNDLLAAGRHNLARSLNDSRSLLLYDGLTHTVLYGARRHCRSL